MFKIYVSCDRFRVQHASHTFFIFFCLFFIYLFSTIVVNRNYCLCLFDFITYVLLLCMVLKVEYIIYTCEVGSSGISADHSPRPTVQRPPVVAGGCYSSSSSAVRMLVTKLFRPAATSRLPRKLRKLITRVVAPLNP